MTGDTVTDKELADLPLNGRNTLALAMTVAGVQGEMGSDEAGIGYNVPSPGSGLSVNGGRPGMMAILSDGMNATSIAYSRATVTFSPDNIEEFRVITSSFSAKYGVTGGRHREFGEQEWRAGVSRKPVMVHTQSRADGEDVLPAHGFGDAAQRVRRNYRRPFLR